MTWGRCKPCDLEMEDWEQARVHSRDQHGGITSDHFSVFEKYD